MRYLRCLALLFTAVFVVSAASSLEKLKEIKTIYVAPLAGADQPVADMLHAKLIGALSKMDGISIVEDEENADAILTGSGLLQSAAGEYGRVHYHLQGGMRLISKEGGVILWAGNVASSRFARSASSSFAENVAKSLG